MFEFITKQKQIEALNNEISTKQQYIDDIKKLQIGDLESIQASQKYIIKLNNTIKTTSG